MSQKYLLPHTKQTYQVYNKSNSLGVSWSEGKNVLVPSFETIVPIV